MSRQRRKNRNRHPRPNLRISPPAFNKITDLVADPHGETAVHMTFQGPLMFPARQVFGQFSASTDTPQAWSCSIVGTGVSATHWDLAVQTDPGGEFYDFDVYGQLTIAVIGQQPSDGGGLPLTLGQVVNSRYA